MFASTPFNKVLRLAFGASLGLLLAKLTNSDQWGVFFTISPVLLLGLNPTTDPFCGPAIPHAPICWLALWYCCTAGSVLSAWS